MTPNFKEQLGCEGSMSQHNTLTLEPCPFCGAQPEQCDVGDHVVTCPSCGVDGPYGAPSGVAGAIQGWNRRAALSATQPAQAAQSDWGAQQFKAPVYPPDGTESPFTVINLGSGKVQMGDSIHDGRLPALWFGINGQGMGHEETMNREARPGETLAVVTFANVEGLDVLLDVIQRIRREKFPEAQAAQGEPAEHWHRLYLEKCQQYNDRVAQLGGVIEALDAEAAQGAGEVVAELKRLASVCPELNLNNYGPDDVDELNAWAVEVAQAIDQLSDTQPAAGADVLDAVLPVGDWSYSHDEERFSGQFDTKEAAIAEGLSCGARFVGQVNHVRDIISDGQIGWDIYERIGEILGDEIGEVAECFTLSPDQQEVLGKVVLDWIESGPGFNCWGIKDVEPIDAAIAAIGRKS